MTLDELVKKVGGEYVRNLVRVRQDGEYVVIGEMVGQSMRMTPAGSDMAAALEEQPKRRGRPRKADQAELPLEE